MGKKEGDEKARQEGCTEERRQLEYLLQVVMDYCLLALAEEATKLEVPLIIVGTIARRKVSISSSIPLHAPRYLINRNTSSVT